MNDLFKAGKKKMIAAKVAILTVALVGVTSVQAALPCLAKTPHLHILSKLS